MRRMARFPWRLVAIATVLQLPALPALAAGSGCIAHHPNYIEGVIEVDYDAGCSGHD